MDIEFNRVSGFGEEFLAGGSSDFVLRAYHVVLPVGVLDRLRLARLKATLAFEFDNAAVQSLDLTDCEQVDFMTAVCSIGGWEECWFPKNQCSSCDDLIGRITALGRQHTRAVSAMWEARYTSRYEQLAEAAEMAHLKLLRAKAELKRHQDCHE